jgi:hypothetical protein
LLNVARSTFSYLVFYDFRHERNFFGPNKQQRILANFLAKYFFVESFKELGLLLAD